MVLRHLNKEIHRHGDDLTGEYRFGDIGQLILLILFLAVWITDSFFLKYTTFLNDHIPLAVQIPLGIIIMIVAGYLALTGLNMVFGETIKEPGVIGNGVFGVVRHPIYLSEILFYLSLLFFRTSLAGLFIWLLAIVFLYYISRYEEKLLLARFGEEYRNYMKDVGMFFPKIWKKK